MLNHFFKYIRTIGFTNSLILLTYTIISGGVYFYILYFNVPSDIRTHIQILLKFLDHGSFPTPPIYYALVYGLHFFMPYKAGYAMAALCVLTAAGFFKFMFSMEYLKAFTPEKSCTLIGPLVFCLMFFSPVLWLYGEGEYWYLGKFTPTIWHNSTSLLAFPFCILLFQLSLPYIEKPKINLLFPIFIVAFTIIWIKPSFIFPFIPAFPLMVYLRIKKFSRFILYAIFLSLILVGLILVEKIIIYDHGLLDELISGEKKSGIALKPLVVWLTWTEHPTRDLFLSFLFPATFILFYFKELVKDTHFIFSTLLVFFGILIFFLFVETGPRHLDGNFYWQIILTLYIWYLVMVKNLLIKILPNGISFTKLKGLYAKDKNLIFLFLIHVLSGFAYLARIIIQEDFL